MNLPAALSFRLRKDQDYVKASKELGNGMTCSRLDKKSELALKAVAFGSGLTKLQANFIVLQNLRE